MTDPAAIILLAKRLEPGAALDALREGCSRFQSLPLYHACIDLLEDCNETNEAISMARVASVFYPDDLGLRLKHALLLPVLYEDMEQMGRWRARFAGHLPQLHAALNLDTAERRAAAVEAIRHHVNFYLAYQGQDDRDLQRQYGHLVQRIVRNLPRGQSSPEKGGRIRLGYISRRISTSTSVSKTFGGWILNRDRERFEVFCYQIGSAPDSSPGEFGSASDHFRHLNGSLESRCEAIRGDRLHAAIFPDVGMSPEMNVLAGMRFAPVQCAAWGHPVTTGSPNIDYFLSASLMEPPHGAEHYTERLIPLPGIGSCYRKPLIPRAILNPQRQRFGLRADSVVYLCCQSTFKYLPCHDSVLASIAERVPDAQFVFVLSHPSLEGAFRRRLDRVLAARYVLLPRLSLLDYWGLGLTSDVYLDSLEFSGFNTALEAVACGLPVVTLEGRFMRGRLGSAVLTQMGVTETIASDSDEYVETAVRLGIDPEWRRQVRHRMAERQQRVFSDTSSVTALESFLLEAVKIGKT